MKESFLPIFLIKGRHMSYSRTYNYWFDPLQVGSLHVRVRRDADEQVSYHSRRISNLYLWLISQRLFFWWMCCSNLVKNAVIYRSLSLTFIESQFVTIYQKEKIPGVNETQNEIIRWIDLTFNVVRVFLFLHSWCLPMWPISLPVMSLT